MVVQWKCWCSDPNTPLDSPGLDLNKFCRGGCCQPALPCELVSPMLVSPIAPS